MYTPYHTGHQDAMQQTINFLSHYHATTVWGVVKQSKFYLHRSQQTTLYGYGSFSWCSAPRRKLCPRHQSQYIQGSGLVVVFTSQQNQCKFI